MPGKDYAKMSDQVLNQEISRLETLCAQADAELKGALNEDKPWWCGDTWVSKSFEACDPATRDRRVLKARQNYDVTCTNYNRAVATKDRRKTGEDLKPSGSTTGGSTEVLPGEIDTVVTPSGPEDSADTFFDTLVDTATTPTDWFNYGKGGWFGVLPEARSKVERMRNLALLAGAGFIGYQFFKRK